ncbi:lytic transglycosylase domain-containing protein [Thiocystis violascens]|uniref:Soluble lytic murein transglycosylase-like protein n=1 Tax=Thiocystis violascens (strain ATCC 17096 / DSM 198 / 6111) TaxID=765911 RepID=I3Y5H2_THIV6|nr:transglycosylase SLT domain-containing protein [Thiocystis violascens]AFL72240.1 soluble lytic murein transglycosylase-like protein [Thiocystis violascens DSM 198]
MTPRRASDGARRRPWWTLARAAPLLWLWLANAPAATTLDPWFEQAVQNREAYRLTAWGKRYEAGVGVDQSARKAIRLYCRAAMQGDAEAKYRLGQVYAFGRGIPNDADLAAAWFYDAAQSDHAKARKILETLKIAERPKRRPSCIDKGGELVSPPTRTVARRSIRPPAEIERLVHALAPHYALDPGLVLALVETESSFDPNARSRKNAQGLMQLIPATALRFGVRDVWDPEQNLRGGMAYLRWLLDYFDGDLKLALAGYNAGEGAVRRHGGIPPYRETRDYVARIVGRLEGAR